eukprot:jgi/Chlat1/5410/Chrsp35S05228
MAAHALLAPTACAWRAPTLASGTGFGAKPKPKPDQKAAGDISKPQKQESPTVQRAVEAVEQRLRIRPEEAARGRLDVVQVDNWGSGDPDDIGNLRVRRFTEGEADVSPEAEHASFYQSLVRHLQRLETQGELQIANQRPLPPFEKWSFRQQNYLQYLVNQYEVHSALEHAVDALASQGASSAVRPLHAFLEHAASLSRSQALSRDIKAVKVMPGSGQLPEPTLETNAFAKYVSNLATEDAVDACPKLIAYLFGLHVTHLTSGMRVGARAASFIPLAQNGALAFYKEYPKVMDTLPAAMQRIGLLLVDLAVQESQ